MFSGKSLESDADDFSVQVVTSVVFLHILNPKYKDQIIKLLRHMTGDASIRSNCFWEAAKFCAEILRVNQAKYVYENKSGRFWYTVKKLSKTKSARRIRDELTLYQKSTHRAGYSIHPLDKERKQKWKDQRPKALGQFKKYESRRQRERNAKYLEAAQRQVKTGCF